MGARAKVETMKLGLLLCVVVAMLAAPSVASADFSFCPQGTGAGQCDGTNGGHGVAVDTETGRVFIADWTSNRIDVFAADGTFIRAFGWGVDTGASKLETCTAASGCQAGSGGQGEGQLFAPQNIAVDNSGGPSQGDVYVFDVTYRVQKFDPEGHLLATIGSQGSGECQFISKLEPIAVGPGGVLYVADGPSNAFGEPTAPVRIQRFSPAGACLGEVTLFEGSIAVGLLVSGLAVDSAGNAFVSLSNKGIREYDTVGNLLGTLADSTEVASRALSIDQAGYLYSVQNDDGSSVIAVYDPAGNIVGRSGYGRLPAVIGLAVRHSSEGDFFISTRNQNSVSMAISYLSLSPPGPIVPPESVEASPVGNAKATIKAKVNPEGKATEVHVDYVDQKGFEEQGNSFAGPHTKSTEAEELSTANGKFRVNVVESLLGCPIASKALIEEGKCLSPETTYRYRVVATNADNPTGKGDGTVVGSFTTKQPLEIKEVFATEAGSDTVTLNAIVNPLGIPASGYFEYVDDATYQESGFAEAVKAPNVDAEEAPTDFGSGEAATKRSVALYPLQAGTAYHYRLVVTNPLIEGSRHSAEKTFRTPIPSGEAAPCPENEAFRSGPSALLPDCRAYEMVSPPDKSGGDIASLEQILTLRPAVLEQSATSGERLAYGSYRAFGDTTSAPYTSQYIAAREAGGWASHSITPPVSGSPIDGVVEFEFEFRAFSGDLCEGWVVPRLEPTLAEGAVPGYLNLYRRSDRLCGEEGYEALSPGKPERHPPTGGIGSFQLEPQGRSADGSVAVFTAGDSLEGTGTPPQPTGCVAPNFSGCRLRLYLKAAGEPLLYACILPSGEPGKTSCTAGSGAFNGIGFGKMRSASVTGAISADGTRVFWSDSAGGEGRIYARENPYAPESAHLHGQAKGTGDLVGPVKATGNLNKTTTVKQVKVTKDGERFAVGQEITASEGIAAGTKIEKIEEPEPGIFTLTLNNKTTLFKGGADFEGVASEVVANAKAESGAFAVGQEISAGEGLAAGATIAKVEEPKPGVFRLTLSAKATRTEAGAGLWSSSECTEAAKACTIAVSGAAEEEAGEAGTSHFWAAAANGSRAIFTVGETQSGIGFGKAVLYEYDLEEEATRKIAGEVAGILGASEDAARVYFASGEVLTGEEANSAGDKAVSGRPNLYLHEAGPGDGSYRFVATLANKSDLAAPGSGTAATDAQPYLHNGRVSLDGAHAAFMSSAPLSGYDNTDASSPEECGEPKGICDTEVFVYDAQANGGAGELLCASCSPSGARPAGASVGIGSKQGSFWVAGRLPTFETTLYAPRVLSEDGSRLFFESADPLVPRDTNGRLDVYEWERAGTGSCEEAGATYSEAAGGCIGLISSGQSKLDSRFVDASPDGRDAFIATLSSFSPQDFGLLDIYDARVGGGFPPPQSPPASCEGEACQGTPEAPNDPTPASSTFEGAGNVHEEATATPTPLRCAKGKVRRHGRCVAKKHKRRAKHNRRAAR